MVVTAAANWHPGVVGLLAARLKERFNRPAFAIALEPGGTGTGSGRSILGVDLGRTVRRAVARGSAAQGRRPRHGGGHHRASTARSRHSAPISKANWRRVSQRRGRSGAADRRRGKRGRRQCRRWSKRSRAPGRSAPAIRSRWWRLPNHIVAYADQVGQAHVRARLRSGDGTMLNAIAFRAAGQPLGDALIKNRGQALHAAGTLSIDRWNGAERVQLRLMDVALPSPG